jgi:protein involved in polysaccharide export with SLBB domain
MVSLAACSASTRNRTSSEAGNLTSVRPISAEQCAALEQIHESAAQETGYQIQPGDQLAIDFYLNSEFNDNVTVDPQGKIALRLVGSLQAAGLTPDQLASSVDKAYQNELRNPGAVVHIHNMPGRQVYVQGEVSKPGAFPLQPGMTVVQAVALAGGTTGDSAPDNTVLIRHDACGQAQGSKVNLAAAMKNPSAGDDVALMSQDVVVVPRSKIANIDLFVKHYIRDAMPFEPYIAPPI